MNHRIALHAAIGLLIATATMAQNPSSLRISLDVGDSTFEMGEPVYASLALTNVGNGTVTVFQNLYPEVGFAGVEVEAPGGEPQTFHALSVDDVEDQPAPLEPGSSATAVFPIFYGANGWTFASPGSYRLAAFYQHPAAAGGERIVSEPITITIAPDPSGAAAELMKGNGNRDEAALFLVWEGGDHLRRGISDLEDLIKRYPKSPTADHARLALGASLSRSFKDYSIGKVREPDFSRALEYLESIEETRFQGYPAMQQSLSEFRCLAGLGRAEEAQAAAARASSLVADRTALRARLDLAVAEDAMLEQALRPE